MCHSLAANTYPVRSEGGRRGRPRLCQLRRCRRGSGDRAYRELARPALARVARCGHPRQTSGLRLRNEEHLLLNCRCLYGAQHTAYTQGVMRLQSWRSALRLPGVHA